jgi:ribose-phosphate pyrophosphokinase
MTTIIAGPGQPQIGEQLAKIVKANLITVNQKLFPDGEQDLRLSKEKCDKETIIVQSLAPPQDRNLHALLQLIYTAEEFGAQEIILVTPYLAYAAKDRRILKGEVVSIANIMKMIEESPATSMIMVDIHNTDILEGKEDFYHNVSAMPAFGEYYKKKKLNDPLVLAPDKGAKERVAILGEVLGAPTDFFEKKRDPVTGDTETIPHELPVDGRDVIIADEMIRTGGSVIHSIEALRKMEVDRIFVAATHLLLINDAAEKILQSGAEEITGTDSVPSKYDKISVAPIIDKALNK